MTVWGYYINTARPQRMRTTREHLKEGYSWRKMEAAAQDRAGWSRVVCGHASLGTTKHKSVSQLNDTMLLLITVL